MSDAQFIFCEGCGARLTPQDRSCPKCGRPAPGILSTHSAASDLAAGKTASFPRLTQERIDAALPKPTVTESVFSAYEDPDATGVLDADMLAAISGKSHGNEPASDTDARSRQHRTPSFDRNSIPLDESAYGPRHRRRRWFAAAAVLALIAGGAWFVTADPLGMMPGFIAQFEQAASDAFPSRQTPEEGEATDGEQVEVDATDTVSDETLSEDAAFERLSVIYDRIIGFQDDLGPAIEDYNGYYIANDRTLREEESASAYDLRDTIQATIDELAALKLADDTAYTEDVEHLTQLATWMYNRVDVLCRSWDISLAVPDGERPRDHQDEILKPLREVEKVDGKAVDVIEFESNAADWKPVQK